MDTSIVVNQRVPVVAAFSSEHARLICRPVKMRYNGREIIFTELGLRHPTTKGKKMVHVFDMTDGGADYRLEFDAERLTWTLTTILEGHYEPGA